MDEAQQASDVSCMSFEDAAEVVRRWVKNEQGRSEEIAEKVVATLKRDHLLSLPHRPRYADFYPESNAKDARKLWKRMVAMILHWVERRPGSSEGHFSKEVLDVLEKVIYPDEVEEGLQGGGVVSSTQVPQKLDEHPSLLDQKQPHVSGDTELNLPTDLTIPREAFSKLYESRESEFLSGATLQQSPGGHGLAFPSWITLPLSFVILVGSPDYEIMDVEVSNGYVDNGDSRSSFVKDGIGFEWLVSEIELPNLQGFLKDMQRMANEVIYRHIDHLRYKNAMKILQSMKQKLWASFKDTPLALWIEVHLAHVLLRVAFMNIEQNAHTLFEEALRTFNRCLNDMNYGERWQYLNRLYCSAYLGRAWYHLINGDLDEAIQDIDRVTRFAWTDPYYCLSANIQVHWARTAVFLSAGDLSNAVKSMGKIGNRVESTRGALNESQRTPLDIHILRSKGELNSALAMCARCILSQEPSVQFDIVTQNASERVQELCMGVIGDVWFALGACNEAYKYYTMARKSGDLILRAAALVGQGNVHMRLRKGKEGQHLERAEEDYKESMSIYERLGHAEGKIIVHCNLGTLFMARGQAAFSADPVLAQGLFDQALHHYKRARELALRLKLRPAIVELDCKMGQVHLEKNDLRKAISLLEESQKLEQAKPEPLVQAWIEHQLGHCLLKCSENEKGGVKADSLRRAEVHLINTIQHFASMQLVTRSTEPHYERLWLTLFEEQKETYALLQWCLACQNRPSDAVVWGERGRSRALMRDKWEDVMHVVGRSPQMNGGHDLWMRNLHPNCFDELSCEAAWESLQRWNSLCHLNAGTAIVQYTICRGFGLLIYIIDGSSKPSVYCRSFAELGNKIRIRSVEDIEHLVVDTVDVLLGDSEKNECDSKEAEQKMLFKLSELLLLPIEEELNKKQRSQNVHQLIIIPHEHLHRVPFPALYCREQTTMLLKKKPRQYLIEKYTLSCVDSIRSLIRCSVLYKSICKNGLQLADQNITKSAALIVGIKDHQSLDLEYLHHAEYEAKSIADICRNRLAKDLIIQLVLGLNATKNLVKQRLAEAQLVHFATHALITTRYEEGGILFAKPPEVKTSGESIRSSLYHAPLEESGGADNFSSSDGAWRGAHVHECTMRGNNLQKELADEVFLDADEISGMKLAARLVVLSACETGRGVIAGEGVAGLGRALTRAGVPCTVLSLWPVQDGAAKELMVAFYTRLSEGMSVAIALQKAMVQMIQEPSSADPGANRWRVKHWAPFQTFGLPSVCLGTESSH